MTRVPLPAGRILVATLGCQIEAVQYRVCLRASRTGRRRKSPDMCSIPTGHPSDAVALSKVAVEIGAYHLGKPIAACHERMGGAGHLRRTTAVRVPNIE